MFDGTFKRVVSEMGAMMNCKFAFYASICEVTKPTDGGQIAKKQLLDAVHAMQQAATTRLGAGGDPE